MYNVQKTWGFKSLKFLKVTQGYQIKRKHCFKNPFYKIKNEFQLYRFIKTEKFQCLLEFIIFCFFFFCKKKLYYTKDNIGIRDTMLCLHDINISSAKSKPKSLWRKRASISFYSSSLNLLRRSPSVPLQPAMSTLSIDTRFTFFYCLCPLKSFFVIAVVG